MTIQGHDTCTKLVNEDWKSYLFYSNAQILRKTLRKIEKGKTK
jgi:hypothetical protein